MINCDVSLETVELFVPDWSQVVIKDFPRGDPFSLPLQPVSGLLEFHSGATGLHRSHLRGVISHRLADGSFYLQDGTGGVLVQPMEPVRAKLVGATVEVAGFPSLTEKLPVIQVSVLKSCAPNPALLTPASLLAE